MELELTVVTREERRDVTVRLGDGSTVAQLSDALGAPDAPGVWVGSRFVPSDRLVASAGLRAGAVLGLDAATPATPRTPAGPVELAAVGGLEAGRAAPLTLQFPVAAGRDPGCGLRLRDPEVSRRHAGFWLRHDGALVLVRDEGSRNGIGRHGHRLDGDTEVGLQEPLRLGETVVEARAVRRVAADLTEDGAGVAFNRPPLLEAPRTRPTLVEPAEPARPKGFRLPWLAALLPLLLGLGVFLLFPQFGAYLVLMMLLSPLLLVANAVSDRRSGRKTYVVKRREYESARQEYDTGLAAAAAADERSSRAEAPDAAELFRRAVAADAALWQRRRRSDGFLQLRIGLTDRPAAVTLQRESTEQPEPVAPIVHDVPVTVPLRAAGVLGIAGPRDALLAAARGIVLQLATLHAPADLALAVLTGADTADDWEWTSWLPHTAPWSDAFACHRLVAADGEQAAARLGELLRLIDDRTAQQRALLAGGPPPGRAVVALLDGARRMRAVPGLAKLLANGPAVGVYAICLDADETALPDECGATVVAAPPAGTRATVRIAGREPIDDVLLDGCGVDLLTAAARALAPLRALGDGEADRELPDRVRFTELAGLQPVAAAVLEGWSARPDGRSSEALLGMAAGEPVIIDLVKDGPHALVAGTSGSGKSELLQTLVASLALANRPDALNFVLVDYKGGSAFAACADLPHCAGLITDLDGHLVSRALESLSAELKRREMLLAEAGAKDIADYWARTGDRLPRLVIVVDEFASLVEEVPDFVPGVVGIGMRGRSLGVHVVLATQRPGGVVSADMRANLNLRICLRVTSDADSGDVIDSPAAGRILPRQPGRGFVRTGHSELVAFQAARVGWPVVDEPEADAVPLVRPRRFAALGLPPERAVASDVDEQGRTDLTDLVRAIGEAAAELGVREPRRPWLPPLPSEVPVAALPAEAPAPARAVIGLVDRPATQAQDPFAIDLDRAGPVLVAGAVRSGRSTALRTVAGALAAASSPTELHLYVLDCGNHALAAVADFPHCGAVVDGADEERTDRLFTLLTEEVARRQRSFSAAGFGSLAEQRAAVAPDDRLPPVVLLLDRLESFVGRYQEQNNGVLVERLETLLRTGPAVGITCVLATDRTGLTHRIGSAVAARLVLAQATPDDLMYFGVDHKAAPSHMPPGRAIWTPTGEEVQVAILGADPSGTAQLAHLRRLAGELTARWDGLPAERRPRRLDPLPEDIDLAGVAALRTVPRPAGAAMVTVGVGGDHLAPVDLDLAALGGCFVICGPGRSGRSTALATIAGSLDGPLPVVAVAPRPSPLRSVPGATVVSADGLAALLADDRPLALVIDDGELIDDHGLQTLLERFVRGARDRGSLLIAAASTEDVLMNRYRGWLSTARRDRCGLLLNPTTHLDGEAFDLRLPRTTSGNWPAGRGLLVTAGETRPVQVATTPAGILR